MVTMPRREIEGLAFVLSFSATEALLGETECYSIAVLVATCAKQQNCSCVASGYDKREQAMEIPAVSGTVRVTVIPKPAWIAMLVEAVGIVIFSVYISRAWALMPLWYRVLLMWAVASAVFAWFYQLSGSEIIAFGAQKLVVIC
jgi:hypothetical protein